MSVMLYPCMFCVSLSIVMFDLCVACLPVFVKCLVNNPQYVMYFGCFSFRGELGFQNSNVIYMCVVNKQFELLEFVHAFQSLYKQSIH